MKKRPPRPTYSATVTARRFLNDHLVRLTLSAPALQEAELTFTDHYVKLLFPPAGAPYHWPFQLAELKETVDRQWLPSLRTYTLRRVDPATGECDIDFVLHGEEGLAGVWARDVEIGTTIAFVGPGGAWRPDPAYDHFVFAGDESAFPAIAAGIEALPAGATAHAFLEIATDDARLDEFDHDNVTISWVPRHGATPGTRLATAVRAAGVPEQTTSWFIHGVAEMIKDLRQFLFVESQVPRADVSISGYWRLGMTEDQWQSSKREFNQAMEQAEQAAVDANPSDEH